MCAFSTNIMFVFLSENVFGSKKLWLINFLCVPNLLRQ